METFEISASADEQPLLADLACPICGGLLIPLRDHMRCSRCCHSFCESCDSPTHYDD